MKWGESLTVDTPTFDEDSDMRLEFRGWYKGGVAQFYLIQDPGVILGKINVPVLDMMENENEV